MNTFQFSNNDINNLKLYKLDHAKFLSAPGLALQAAFKKR